MANPVMPPEYSPAELGRLARLATDCFVAERHRSEQELWSFYHDRFAESYDAAARVLSETDDLLSLKTDGKGLLIEGLLPVLRSMDRPTVSEDDFKSLSDTGTVAPSRFSNDELAAPALEYLSRNLNTDIFPWIKTGRHPTGRERHSACVAVAALIAEQKTKTRMRGQASGMQEEAVRDVLVAHCGMKPVDGADFHLLTNAPAPGEVFKRETKVAGMKADIVAGLFDGRILCLECKVSNSEVNSYKRLNHEVVDKVAKWRQAFGMQCVSAAVLQGCFKAANLLAAQNEGAYLFWSTDLTTLIDFVNSTKAP